ncbi:hypothetical protein ACQP3L_35725, partial [Escherichia coli]
LSSTESPISSEFLPKAPLTRHSLSRTKPFGCGNQTLPRIISNTPGVDAGSKKENNSIKGEGRIK